MLHGTRWFPVESIQRAHWALSVISPLMTSYQAIHLLASYQFDLRQGDPDLEVRNSRLHLF